MLYEIIPQEVKSLFSTKLEILIVMLLSAVLGTYYHFEGITSNLEVVIAQFMFVLPHSVPSEVTDTQ